MEKDELRRSYGTCPTCFYLLIYMLFLRVYVASISHRMRCHRILELLDAFLCGGLIGTLLAPFQWGFCKNQ